MSRQEPTQGREFYMVMNGKIVSLGCSKLWDPIFSPDGSRLLMKAVEFGRFLPKSNSGEKLLR